MSRGTDSTRPASSDALPGAASAQAGAGVGAAVGAAGGAAGAESDASGGTAARYSSNYAVDDAHYDQMNQGVAAGGRAVAIEESVPQGALDAALQRHGGHLI